MKSKKPGVFQSRNKTNPNTNTTKKQHNKDTRKLGETLRFQKSKSSCRSVLLHDDLEEKFGRLVGATELEKGPASQTKLDVLPGFRNTVLRTKQVIIGCGGGFHQECTQPYSPVARWMSDVDVALNDEGQQFGNLDEASAIARVPRKGLVVWCGDHKQTPGGLRKSDEAGGVQTQVDAKAHCLEGRHQVHTTTYAGRHSPSVCARCAWTLSGRIEAAPSGKEDITPCCCAAIAVL